MQTIDAPALETSPVTATDRMAMTLFFALALHAMIILGITFGFDDETPPQNVLPTLDITVSSRHTPPPDEADYLAESSQDGGGNTTEKVRPTEAIPEQAPAVTPQQATPAPAQVITADVASRKQQQQDAAMPDTSKPDITATDLIERSMEMINLNEQLNQSMQAYAERPRHIYVSARTQEFKYANYMREWVKKVERVGNLNYPDDARRKGLSGKLIMDVTMNADGTVRNINIMRSSGHSEIDEAATRIVNLAAPFPPFPSEILKDADVLHITRTWEFSTSNQMTSH